MIVIVQCVCLYGCKSIWPLLQQRTDDTDTCDFTFASYIRLSSSLPPLYEFRSNPAVYHSLSPYHTKPGKAHPRGIGEVMRLSTLAG